MTTDLNTMKRQLEDLEHQRVEIDQQIKALEAAIKPIQIEANERALQAVGLSIHKDYRMKPEYDAWYREFARNSINMLQNTIVKPREVEKDGLIRVHTVRGITGLTPADLLEEVV